MENRENMDGWTNYYGKHLDLRERHATTDGGVSIRDEAAHGYNARRVVLHMERYRAAGFGAAAYVVELEAHECLHEGALPIRLVPHHQHRRRVEGRLELLSQPVQLVIRLVELSMRRRRKYLLLVPLFLLPNRRRRQFVSSSIAPLDDCGALLHGSR